ncbi:helix-turn-helix transcriptional regulator [Brachybacterium sp. YJGR34]|uniref:ArsR/SmtB family transcription factor n=1 Tax=Brachybacterium sp. YJGR34 TaxID=2059911 RepID=UPI000E0BE9D6|nr:helix-turn-helix domain-containing protein [Brachybacterium sp. YJGR34]
MTTAAPAATALLTEEADEVFGLLADRTRRRILVRLAEKPDDAGAVARDLELTRQGIAKQLHLLEDAGLVGVSRVSRRRVHHVDPARIREISDLLGLVARGWDRRLEQVKERAEAQVAQRAEEQVMGRAEAPRRE